MAGERPPLDKGLDAGVFYSFYWLKEELAAFCRLNGLPASGSKEALTERIAAFLNTGAVLLPVPASAKKAAVGVIAGDMPVEPDFVCSEIHRAFFKKAIGKGFSFNVAFQKWLKANTGKTYDQAIAAYYEILAEKKKGMSVIDKQFEYNTYIRAFFAENPGKSLNQAIACWNYKKSRQGHNRYESTDLAALG